jgi:hypothetical protein
LFLYLDKAKITQLWFIEIMACIYWLFPLGQMECQPLKHTISCMLHNWFWRRGSWGL